MIGTSRVGRPRCLVPVILGLAVVSGAVLTVGWRGDGNATPMARARARVLLAVTTGAVGLGLVVSAGLARRVSPSGDGAAPSAGPGREAMPWAAITAALRRTAQLDDLATVFARIVEEGAHLVEADGAVLRLLEGHELAAVARTPSVPRASADDRVMLAGSLSGRTLSEGPAVAADPAPDEHGPWPGTAPAPFRAVLAVPVRADDRAIGTLAVYSRRPRLFSPTDTDALATFAEHAAIAIGNARRYGAQQNRTARLRTLGELSRVVTASLDPGDVLPAIGAAARELMHARLVAFWRADETARTLSLLASSGEDVVGADFPVRVLGYGEGVVGWAAEHRRSIHVPDVLGSRQIEARQWWYERGMRSVLAVPIVLGHSLLAVVSLWGETPFDLGADDQEVLDAFTDQAALAIRNAEVFAASERRRRAAEALAGGAKALAESLDPTVVAQRIIDSVGALIGGHLSIVFELDPVSGALVSRATSADVLETLGTPIILEPGVGVAGLAAKEARTVVSPNALEDPSLILTPALRHSIEMSPYRAVLAVPLIVHGRVLGTLSVGDRVGRVFDDEDLRLTQAFAHQAALALNNARVAESSRVQRVRLEALLEISRQLAAIQPVDSLLRRIAEGCGLLFASDSVDVRLREGDRLVIRASWGDPAGLSGPDLAQAGERLSSQVAAAGHALVVTDLKTDVRLAAADRAALADSGYRAWLGVPVTLGTHVFGVLGIGTRQQSFSASDVALASAFAAHAAVAIENARLFSQADERARHFEALTRLTQLINGATEVSEIFAFVTRSAQELIDAALVRLWIARPESQELMIASTHGVNPEIVDRMTPYTVIPYGRGLIGSVPVTREPVFVADVRESDAWLNKDLVAALGLGGYGSVPLLAGDRVVGVLSALTVGRRDFTPDERRVLTALGEHAALAIEKAQLYRDAQVRVEQLRRLAEVTHHVSSSLDLETLLDAVTEATLELLQVDRVHLWVADEREGVVRLAAVHPPAEEIVPRDVTCGVGEGVVGSVVATGTPRYSPNLRAESLPVGTPWSHDDGFTSQLALPLLAGGRAVGALVAVTRAPREFTADEQEIVALFAGKAAIALENAELYRRARQRADRLAALSEVTRLLSSAGETADVCEAVARAATTLLAARNARVWVAEPDTGRLRVAGTFGAAADAERATTFEDVTLGESIVEQATEEYIEDVQSDPRFSHGAQTVQADYRSGAVVPLMRGPRAIGGLVVFFTERRRFADEEKNLVRMLADEAAVAIEKSRLLEATQRALTALEERNADLDSFVYVVSHDLKAPLVTIQGMASMLLEDCAEQLDARGRHYVGRIEANIVQMERLIGDLLTLSRVGRESQPPEMVDIAELLDELLAGMAESMRARGVQVVRGELGAVRAIRTQLVQVFGNLLGNAVKYLGEQPAPRVEVGRRPGPGGPEFWVRDNGIGIDPAYHAQVFELFQRLKEVPVEGTGVGLAIVKKIVEAAGGRVRVDSMAGQGATFIFNWPSGGTGA